MPLLYAESVTVGRTIGELERRIHSEGTLEMIETLSRLRTRISKRCEELRAFYEGHSDNNDAPILLKAWLLMRSLLSSPTVTTLWKP